MIDRDDAIIRDLLERIDSDEEINQRALASELGIALGMTNAYLKRCVKKGWVKVRQVPARRYRYYLTPKGFSEKSRLTAEYFTQSFKFFRAARVQCSELFALCAERGWHNVVLVGASDLGEIATLCASEFPVNLIGVADARTVTGSHAGLPVYRDLTDMDGIDAAMVTDLLNPQGAFEEACRTLPPDRVLAPLFMRVSRQGPRLEK